MLRSRLAALAVTAVTGVGLTVPLAAGAARADTVSPTPTVTDGGSGAFTVALPGVGTLTFSLDSAGAISKVVATPAAGLSASDPVVTTEGVEVAFTSGGTTRILEVEVERDNGDVRVKAEADVEDGTETGDHSPAAQADRSGRDRGNQRRDTAEHTSSTAVHAEDSSGHQNGTDDNTNQRRGQDDTGGHPSTSVESPSGSGGSHGGHD